MMFGISLFVQCYFLYLILFKLVVELLNEVSFFIHSVSIKIIQFGLKFIHLSKYFLFCINKIELDFFQ